MGFLYVSPGQKPGPLNALGQVKFMFPSSHSVYLHDTPTRGLFARAERNFSSGCIRVERPLELAEYLLADRAQWSAERTVRLGEKVPVHLQYWMPGPKRMAPFTSETISTSETRPFAGL